MITSRLARLLCRPLEVGATEPRPADAIAVLGAAPGIARTERIEVGVALWRQNLAPTIVMSGRGEAAAMAARARELGAPDSALLIEERARTTRENAERTAELLGAGARVLVVSQPFHLRRAARLFRAAGLEPIPIAAGDSVQHRRPDLAVRWAIREYAAWLKVAAGLSFLL